MSETLSGFHRVLGSYGVLAPAKIPRPMLHRISNEIVRITNMPDVREQFQAIGLMVAPLATEEYSKMLINQIDALASLARGIGLQPR